jgi:hypothetical protein
MSESPQDREQPIEDREWLNGFGDPTPRASNMQRSLDLVRAAVRDCIVLLLVPFQRSLPFRQIQHDATRGAANLVAEVAIALLDERNELA